MCLSVSLSCVLSLSLSLSFSPSLHLSMYNMYSREGVGIHVQSTLSTLSRSVVGNA